MATRAKTLNPLDTDTRRTLVSQVAEQMVIGYGLTDSRLLREKHNLSEAQIKGIEADARKVLHGFYEAVSRPELVAQSLAQLEYIAKMAIETRQYSVAQASRSTILRMLGVDAPKD